MMKIAAVFTVTILIVCLVLGALPGAGGGGHHWVSGNGTVDISMSIVDRRNAFEYSMTGDGQLEMGRNMITYSGDVPLQGLKRLQSKSFWGGSGLSFQEAYSVNQMEREQSSSFRSTGSEALGFDTKVSFNGTWVTDVNLQSPFSKDITSHQMFSGEFDIDKHISFGGWTDRRPSLPLIITPPNYSSNLAQVGESQDRDGTATTATNATETVQDLNLTDSSP